jgi:hypothetical protein
MVAPWPVLDPVCAGEWSIYACVVMGAAERISHLVAGSPREISKTGTGGVIVGEVPNSFRFTPALAKSNIISHWLWGFGVG